MSWILRHPAFFPLLLPAACKDRTFPVCEVEDVPVRQDTPTWHGEIRALVESECGSCHIEGGLGPQPLLTYEQAAPWAPVMAEQVRSRAMPPWPPVDCCRPLLHSLALSPDEIAAFEAWAEGGAPEGDPGDYLPPELPETGLPRVDARIEMPEPYTPSPRDGTTDDTRCFLLDFPDTDDRFVTGLGVLPGTPEQVHHALLLVAGPLSVPSLQLLDAADPGPGWSCPGGIVWGATGWIGGWSPGWTAREMPRGTGQKVERGAKVILTVHYSVPTGQPAPDRSAVELMLDDEVDSELDAISVFDPVWLSGGMRIRADEPDVMVSHLERPLAKKTLVGVNLHMHERGSRGSVGILRRDGSRECLLQIDDWEHGWQGDYLLADPVELGASDALWVECHFDNTAGNQRVVDGKLETPRDLGWAEDEEMCVAFVMARD